MSPMSPMSPRGRIKQRQRVMRPRDMDRYGVSRFMMPRPGQVDAGSLHCRGFRQEAICRKLKNSRPCKVRASGNDSHEHATEIMP